MSYLFRFNESNNSFGLIASSFFVVLAFFTIVMPNSFQIATALIMILCTVIAFFYISASDISIKFISFMILNILITLTYLLVGVINMAPEEAIKQVVIIYIVSPFLWFVILTALLTRMSSEKIIKTFIYIAWSCCFAVILFFYLFKNFGPESVSLFSENSNLDIRDGYSGATIHVYGSLIFIVGGFFAAPELIKNKLLMFATLTVLALAAITSGRAALIISIFIGFLIFLFFSSNKIISIKSKITFLFFIFFISSLVIYLAFKFVGLDISYIATIIGEKITSGGGEERANQSQELLRSAFDNYGIGRGHGIGIDYIRSEEFPWRYESIWWATLHRVGVLGSFIYVASFIYYIFSTLINSTTRGLTSFEKFLFGGFMCIFAASNTNPYLEAIPFQWMFMLPILALMIKSK